MQLPVSAVAILIIISTLQWTSGAIRCREACFRRCIKKLTQLIEDEYPFQIQNGTESEEAEYCMKMVEACLETAFEDCGEDHHVRAAISVTLFNHMNEGCSSDPDSKKLFTSLSPCLEKNSATLKNCSTENALRNQKLEYPVHKLASVCTDMKSMMCLAGRSRELCGPEFSQVAETVEFTISDSYYELCNDSVTIFHNFWVLVTSGLATLMLNQKMKH